MALEHPDPRRRFEAAWKGLNDTICQLSIGEIDSEVRVAALRLMSTIFDDITSGLAHRNRERIRERVLESLTPEERAAFG